MSSHPLWPVGRQVVCVVAKLLSVGVLAPSTRERFDQGSAVSPFDPNSWMRGTGTSPARRCSFTALMVANKVGMSSPLRGWGAGLVGAGASALLLSDMVFSLSSGLRVVALIAAMSAL